MRDDKVTPSTAIENGTAIAILVFVALIAKVVTGKLKPTNTPKLKNVKKVEEVEGENLTRKTKWIRHPELVLGSFSQY